MSSTYEEMVRETEDRLEETRIVQAWTKFLRRPQNAFIRDNDANLEMFKSGFADTRQFDADACQLLLDNPDFVRRLSTTTEGTTRAELIEGIIGLLTKARSQEQLAEERKRLQYFEVDALKKRHEQLSQAKALERNFTRRQLHAISSQPVGPEPVPATLTRVAFSKMTTAKQRLALQRYTADALNIAWAIQEGRN